MPNSSTLPAEPTEKQKKLVTIGCIILALAIGAYGLSLSTVQGPILRSIHAENMFSLITTFGSLAVCIMTPIGGRLTDTVGCRNIILYSEIAVIIVGGTLPFLRTGFAFLIGRFLLSTFQGLLASTPYILVREVNPPERMPAVMGFLTGALALGGFLGSYLAGVFTDWNQLWLAMIFPILFMLPALPLISKNMPAKKVQGPIHLDWLGLLFLVLTLSGTVLALNFGPSMGWGSWQILLGFAIGIISLVCLIMVERKSSIPLIPLRMFSNKLYTCLLIFGFLAAFYMIAMNVYVPKGVQDIMKASNAVSGSLQIPRTIVSILLPSIVGAWLMRNQTKRTWMSLALSGLCIAICFSGLIFMGVRMPVWFVIVMLTFTGASDSFRSVALTPAVQKLLAPKDMGIGTSMIGFFIILSSLFSSAVYGIAFDTLSRINEAGKGEIYGLDTVFLIAAVTGFAAMLIAGIAIRHMSLSGKYDYKPEAQNK